MSCPCILYTAVGMSWNFTELQKPKCVNKYLGLYDQEKRKAWWWEKKMTENGIVIAVYQTQSDVVIDKAFFL